MQVGREDIDRFLGIMERSAAAQERLIELATEEREVGEVVGPPYCPSCGHFNPNVTLDMKAVGGPLGDFALVAKCDHCEAPLFAMPEGWQVFKTGEELIAYQEGRDQDEHS